jgi:hypothetical protein
MRCEDGSWIELAQDCVQWRALVLVMMNFQFCYRSAITVLVKGRIMNNV